MKTSNKLLIALAVSLIIIPIIVVAITVKMNYRDAKSFREESKTMNRFATPTEGFSSREIVNSFSAVSINDAKGMFLNIQLIKDSKAGIKIQEKDKNAISFNVDENGTLQLSIKDIVKGASSYASLIIYSPNFKQLSMAKGQGLSLSTTADSLLLNTTSMTEVSIGSESKINKITAIANDVDRLNFSNNLNVGFVNLELKNSNFESEWASYKSLIINAEGNSDINISGQNDNSKKFQIDNLYIKTSGKSDLKLENIKVIKSSGSLSDSTSVSMSASILKTLFNK
ncbi:hypothetical protein [Pedobacter sp. Leaf176]|uniref:hypothetical protein n=1 Tax=Pedobacter sp. Leaf176 TaxID=1736286 RepID=UPI000AA8DA04|nr:hypothetical protein [Pedobacter sp. Leaf176]